jgi:hypothetical protein
MVSVFSFWVCKESNMTRDDIIRMAGHREVPAWVMKLVMDCIEAEREACAVTLETEGGAWNGESFEIAGAIRARGMK